MANKAGLGSRHGKSALTLSAVLLLSACTTLMPQTVAQMRALDTLNDDIASLVVAFDLPLGIEALPDSSALRFDVVSPQGERHVRASLVRGDVGEVAGRLPPPAEERTYFLFGFSESDKEALREAQRFARSLGGGAAVTSSFPVSVSPEFCARGEVDFESARFSVLIALPVGVGLQPLLLNQSLTEALLATGQPGLRQCS